MASSKAKGFSALEKLKRFFFKLFVCLLTVCLGVLLSCGFGKTYVMQEGSMDATLSAGDCLLIDRFSVHLGELKRGDIIAFRLSDDEQSSTHVKRIIGLPGETIQIKDGQIQINGETYTEQKNFPSIQNPGIAEEEITLGTNEYFVLGDNRNNSEDSRFATVGNIEKSWIIGKVWFIISPWDKFGFPE